MTGRIKVIELRQTCYACPSQWEGMTDDGRQVYVRYRWGHGSVRVGEPGDNARFAAVEGEEVFAWIGGGEYDGDLSEAELREITREAVEWPLVVESLPDPDA